MVAAARGPGAAGQPGRSAGSTGSPRSRAAACSRWSQVAKGRRLGQRAVDFDDGERGPLVSECTPGGSPRGQAHGAEHLHEADATRVPPVRAGHRVADEIAAVLADVALHQRARVEVQAQRSASRSARTICDALRVPARRRGALAGCGREGGTTRPAATSSRRRSSFAAPAGTMSATGFPRTVTRTCSPAPTARSVSLRESFSSGRRTSDRRTGAGRRTRAVPCRCADRSSCAGRCGRPRRGPSAGPSPAARPDRSR